MRGPLRVIKMPSPLWKTRARRHPIDLDGGALSVGLKTKACFPDNRSITINSSDSRKLGQVNIVAQDSSGVYDNRTIVPNI